MKDLRKNSLKRKFGMIILIMTYPYLKMSGSYKIGQNSQSSNKPFENFDNVISKHSAI